MCYRTWIRTKINGVRVHCPAVRRSGKVNCIIPSVHRLVAAPSTECPFKRFFIFVCYKPRMAKILIIDDNLELTRLINLYVSKKHRTSLVFSVEQALRVLAQRQFDLVIIDRILPDGDGLEALEFLRDKQLLTPVLMLSNKSQVEERVRGLRQGADDYMAKPFSMEELLLKIDKLLNTTKKLNQNEVHVNRITIFEKEGKVFVGKREIELRRREFEILLFLGRHQNQVISRNMLIENLWGEEECPSYSTIDVYIRRLRMLLGEAQSQYIRTFRGYGYMIKSK